LGVKKKIAEVILLSLMCLNTFIPQQQAYAETCPIYDFQTLFFEEYSGTKWDNRNGIIGSRSKILKYRDKSDFIAVSLF